MEEPKKKRPSDLRIAFWASLGVVVFVLALAGIVFFMLRRSDAFAMATAKARSSSAVTS